MGTIESEKEVTSLMHSLLEGAGFDGLYFGTHFSLFFNREAKRHTHGLDIPNHMELHILGDWWFGEKSAWEKEVSRRGAGVEPSEPVLAFELAKLRWTENSWVKQVFVEDATTSLIFMNDVSIAIAHKTDDEYAYTLSERQICRGKEGFSLTVENENFFYYRP